MEVFFKEFPRPKKILEICSTYIKVPRLGDESKAKNQQEKLMEAEGLGLETSSK